GRKARESNILSTVREHAWFSRLSVASDTWPQSLSNRQEATFTGVMTPGKGPAKRQDLLRNIVMYRQPNRRLIGCGPLDSVLLMCGDIQPISRLHSDRLFIALEPEPCLTLHHRDPLVLVLVVPEAIRRGLDVRND